MLSPSWFRSLKSHHLHNRTRARKTDRTRQHRRRLQVEQLEHRWLPSFLINEYPIPTPNSGPNFMTLGPDGNMWFDEENGGIIGRITPAGTISEFAVPDPSPQGPIAGPDGNIWFPELTLNMIAVVTPAGTLIHQFPIPTIANNYYLTLAPDGNIWFADYDRAYISQIITQGPAMGTITQFPIPFGADSITTGPDGNLWFTATNQNLIGSMNTAGVIEGEWSPTNTFRYLSITAGPDGNLWAIAQGANAIVRINTSGRVESLPCARNAGFLLLSCEQLNSSCRW
jgi:streptogramin lyase